MAKEKLKAPAARRVKIKKRPQWTTNCMRWSSDGWEQMTTRKTCRSTQPVNYEHVHLKKMLIRVTKIKATVVKMGKSTALLESKSKTKVKTETHLGLTCFL